MIARTRKICAFIFIISLAQIQAFGENEVSSVPPGCEVGLLNKYLKNEKAEIVGVVLKSGKRARFVCPMPEDIAHLNERCNPRDKIEVTFHNPPKAEDVPKSCVLPRFKEYQKLGLTSKTPLIWQIKNLKTGAGSVQGPLPMGIVCGPRPSEVNYFGYIERVQVNIKKEWLPPKELGARKTVVCFNIQPNGQIEHVHLKKSSGAKTADEIALTAIEKANPLPPLPEDKKKSIYIEFTFDYVDLIETKITKFNISQ